ncbi:hypothetical protein LINPERHAP1_LOCUS31062 [Linum perenne]
MCHSRRPLSRTISLSSLRLILSWTTSPLILPTG